MMKLSVDHNAQSVRHFLARARWYGDPSGRICARMQGDFSVFPVKKNPKRTVLRLNFPDGEEFYLKLFAPQIFPFSLLHFYAKEEYSSAKVLERLSLPVIDYAAWGRVRSSGFCISRGVPSSRECRRYYFETAWADPEKQQEFLTLLCSLICSMKKVRLFHPDFHLGNILYSTAQHKLFLPDPYGLKQKKIDQEYLLKMCHPFLELCNFVPEETLANCLCASTLASDPADGALLLKQALASFRARREKEYEKLKKRVLGGKSKYATEIPLDEAAGGGVCAFRHTLWYAPPEKMQIDPAWRAVAYDSTEGSEKIWVDSFLSVPQFPSREMPLARRILPSGGSVLYYGE